MGRGFLCFSGLGMLRLKILILIAFFAASCGPKDQLFEIVSQDNQSQLLLGGHVVYEGFNISNVETFDLGSQALAVQWQDSKTGHKQVSSYANGVWSSPVRPQLGFKVRFDLDSDKKASRGLYLIQFKSPISPAIRTWLAKHSVEIHRFIPENALLVSSRNDLLDLERFSLVHRVLPFQTEWKQENLEMDIKVSDVLMMPVDRQKLDELVRFVESQGAEIYLRSEVGLLGVKASPEQIEAFKMSALVLWMERDSEIGLDMDVVRDQGGANFLSQSSGGFYPYTGIGIKGHVFEGINPDHGDFAANEHRERPISVQDTNVSSHGHRTFGILFGSGAGDAKATGLLPNGQGFYTNYVNIYRHAVGDKERGGRYELTKRLVEEYGIHFQTASWGNQLSTEYGARSAELDQIIFDLDLPVFQSQSNSGNRNSRPQAWAKNVVSVGGVFHGETADPTDDQWDAGRFSKSSTGPASDGRIKPDLVGYMDGIYTADARGGYSEFGGTSGATPLIAGHLGLIVEMWQRGDLPLRKTKRPAAATLKGLLLHSARQYRFSGSNSDLSRYKQGWGFPDLQNLFELSRNLFIIDEETPLLMNTSYRKAFKVSGDKELLATMVYKDPPGVPSSAVARVNDLNLKLTSPSGEIYWGNHGLRYSMWSAPGGDADPVDTVERIMIKKPESGLWTVEVSAKEINMDSNPNSEEIDAVFSLLLSH